MEAKRAEKSLLRLVDANFNRAKEGLRVVEDIFRFVIKKDNIRNELKLIRHSLDKLTKKNFLSAAIKTRDSINDPGRKEDETGYTRLNLNDIIYANFQRIKESLRTLEEALKLLSPKDAGEIKKNRFKIYSLEKKVLCLKKLF